MKLTLAMAFLTVTTATAFAQDRDPSRAIQFLQELKEQKDFEMSGFADLDGESFRLGPPTLQPKKIDIKSFIKFHAGERFKLTIRHNLPPLDGFNFEVTQAAAQLAHVTPTGGDFGQENIGGGWSPRLSYGQAGTFTSAQDACVNGFVYSYEVVIKEIADTPDGKFLFGPYAVPGSKGPIYDCFLEAIDTLQ
jgi:hypothetical protein